MELGAFSVSLTVQDLAASRAFYEKLDFEVTGGGEAENYLILRNGDTLIGLFQGMFEKNILTFNPGLSNRTLEPVADYTDVREIHRVLKERGLELDVDSAEGEAGPGHIVLSDPDGNPILIDQFQ